MKLVLQEETRYEVEVNTDAFIEAFADEWADWIGPDPDTEEDRRDFIKESIYIMGARDFAHEVGLTSDSPVAGWIVKLREDYELDVRNA